MILMGWGKSFLHPFLDSTGMSIVNTKKQPGDMNDKLVRRAASKYKSWMHKAKIQCRRKLVPSMINSAQRVFDKSKELRRLTRLLVYAGEQKIQRFPWDISEPCHFGLIPENTRNNMMATLIKELREDLLYVVRSNERTLESLSKDTIFPLSYKAATEEIYAIMAAWEEVRFRDNLLSVCVKDIVLSDHEEKVNLGSFWIRVDITDPFNTLIIESVDEICSVDGGYHPHVKHEVLCCGDGADIMNAALYEGRLEDYFTIIESILRTYNDDSPHYQLCEWYAPENQFTCINCEESYGEEEAHGCFWCEGYSCVDCFTGGECAGCATTYCGECLKSCDECAEEYCTRCLTSCSECHNSVCESCTSMCHSCDNNACNSCTNPCTNCGDNICNDCQTECCGCSDTFCDDCLDEKCTQCLAGVCNGCRNECEDCGKIVCDSCYNNTCEHCGTSTCTSCSENHQCLLAEIDK